MGAPYASVSISGYNANPPADDGSEVPANLVTWSGQKTKLADPIKDQVEAIDTALVAAFAKVLGGAGITTSSGNYQALSSDQAKLIKCTAAQTVTTPDATSVGAPFVFGVLNNSSGSVVVDGSGSQTVDGAASITLGPGAGCLLITDGSNWNTFGLQSILQGNQIGNGVIINGTLVASNATNAATYAVKTLAGADPSASDPVLIGFRNATAATGNYVYRAITSALSITIPSTATLGATSGTEFRLWVPLFDDGGTVRIGVINCLSDKAIYPLGRFPIASSTQIGTGSDSAHVFYTNGAAVTSKAYVILGYGSYESDGLATAGTWNVDPTRLHLQGPSDPLPGDVIQTVPGFNSAFASGAVAIPHDDTIPQNTEGTEFMTTSITPTSAANLLEQEFQAKIAGVGAATATAALFRDSGADAISASGCATAGATSSTVLTGAWALVAGSVDATTFKLRIGDGSGNTIFFNGISGTGRTYGGVSNSFLGLKERMT